jgi:hypothetical protein
MWIVLLRTGQWVNNVRDALKSEHILPFLMHLTKQNMSTYNFLHTEMTCPYCGQTSKTEVNLYFGNTIFMDTFAIGDTYKWIPRKAVQNGGRPDNGDIDGAGYATCPLCDEGYHVKVIVRQDRIEGVSINTEKL